MPTHSLPIADIVRDTALQPRSVLDSEIIQEYAERITAGDEFPALDVWDTPEGMLLSSGFHRAAAYESAGKRTVQCNVRQGTRRDALLHAIGENKTHGNRRSNADKRRAVEMVLRDSEWVKWTDRRIAEHCGVHHTFVGNVRNQLATVANSEPSARVGKDGKTYKATKPAKPEPVAAGGVVVPPEDVDQNEYFDSDFDSHGDPRFDEVEYNESAQPQEEPDIEDEPQVKIPEKFKEASAYAAKCKEWAKRLHAIGKEIEKSQDTNEVGSVFLHPQSIRADIANAKRGIVFGTPHALCPWCNGRKCTVCRNAGYVNKTTFEKRETAQ